VTPPLRGAKSTKAAAASGPLYSYGVRREGRPVVTLTAVTDGDASVTVETEVFPVTLPPGVGGVRRPFRFASADAAEKFAEETLLALEYLNCDVVV
jgi:hypothetical protein